MIVNPNETMISEWYKCNKHIADYLVYTCKIPFVSMKGGVYYFVKTDELNKRLKRLPLGLKIMKIFRV
jgi:hypothetical protein